MTTAEFIAKYNTPGVVAFAKQHGYDIPNDPQHAYDFLKQAWDSDAAAVKAAMKDLHPHANFIGGDGLVDQQSLSKLKRYRNFDASQFEDAGSEAMDIMERGINKGKELASSLLNCQNNNGVPQVTKDHTKEILTYGAVLLAGIFIGKFLMK